MKIDIPNWQDVLHFWFHEIQPEKWFGSDPAFDQTLRDRFGLLHEKVRCCEMESWRKSLEGRLAEIIVLDQFSRNIFRGTAQSFSQDTLALALAQEAIRDPDHRHLPAPKRAFLYMPFMHSESPLIHEQAVTLFSQPGLESNLRFEILHKNIIDRFGRYPHRNQILGRVSTPEEVEFLAKPGSSF